MASANVDEVIVLHTRPYSETSLVVETFSLNSGRLTLLAKGSRSSGKSNKRAVLQMSSKLEVAYSGKSSMKSLNRLEVIRSAADLAGEKFAMGCYISELTMRLMHPEQVNQSIFYQIDDAFGSLSDKYLAMIALRRLEDLLLMELGTPIDWASDIEGHSLLENEQYCLVNFEGFQRLSTSSNDRSYSGKLLLSVTKENQLSSESMNAWREINNQLLTPHLGTKPLQSRKLLQQWKKS
ncbi:DNA repair protein RecO [Pleionea litopenaei]|uniref:DNA repair protein RecO n=1 Tax=Pleionea litopenaei TaxID=3070815 RepID=A0AA51X7U0_9GAMM|nr:DNA repair protein RecO [Pleionea sp. HL-JVS1]WMS88583.1 DNA repair protein RecO [Pleionea sp. HL-JVS1]